MLVENSFIINTVDTIVPIWDYYKCVVFKLHKLYDYFACLYGMEVILLVPKHFYHTCKFQGHTKNVINSRLGWDHISYQEDI